MVGHREQIRDNDPGRTRSHARAHARLDQTDACATPFGTRKLYPRQEAGCRQKIGAVEGIPAVVGRAKEKAVASQAAQTCCRTAGYTEQGCANDTAAA